MKTRKHKLIVFSHIEKCGGTTLIKHFRRIFGARHCDIIPQDRDAMHVSEADVKKTHRLLPGLRSVAGHSIRSQQIEYWKRHFDSAAVPIILLRNPVDRYLSDFRHFVRQFGFADSLSRWIAYLPRQNFMTKAIAGTPCSAQALEILQSHYSAVGVLENFDDFLHQVASAAEVPELNTGYQVENRGWGAERSLGELEQFRSEIESINEEDIKLYRAVKASIIRTDRASRQNSAEQEFVNSSPVPLFRQNINNFQNLVVRNLYYKPGMGYPPGPYRLPFYRRMLRENTNDFPDAL